MLHEHGETILIRPSHVMLDADGPFEPRVTRVVPQEDASRLDLELGHGRVYTRALPRTRSPCETVGGTPVCPPGRSREQ
jgi:hypothetical protein